MNHTRGRLTIITKSMQRVNYVELCPDCPRRTGKEFTKGGLFGRKIIEVTWNREPAQSGKIIGFETDDENGTFISNDNGNTGTVTFMNKRNVGGYVNRINDCIGATAEGNDCPALGRKPENSLFRLLNSTNHHLIVLKEPITVNLRNPTKHS